MCGEGWNRGMNVLKDQVSLQKFCSNLIGGSRQVVVETLGCKGRRLHALFLNQSSLLLGPESLFNDGLKMTSWVQSGVLIDKFKPSSYISQVELPCPALNRNISVNAIFRFNYGTQDLLQPCKRHTREPVTTYDFKVIFPKGICVDNRESVHKGGWQAFSSPSLMMGILSCEEPKVRVADKCPIQ